MASTTQKPSKKQDKSKKLTVSDELEEMLNNGVSRKTPFYKTINIDKYC